MNYIPPCPKHMHNFYHLVSYLCRLVHGHHSPLHPPHLPPSRLPLQFFCGMLLTGHRWRMGVWSWCTLCRVTWSLTKTNRQKPWCNAIVIDKKWCCYVFCTTQREQRHTTPHPQNKTSRRGFPVSIWWIRGEGACTIGPISQCVHKTRKLYYGSC